MEIDKYIPQILDAIESNPIVSVSAPTGSGKSIGIPKGAAEQGFRIFVGVPTIAAARTLMTYQNKISPNIPVGFGAEGEKNYTDETMIIYATHGHLKNYLLQRIKEGKCQDVDDVDVIMLDEAHTGTVDITMILSLWVYCAKGESAVPRLLISSATLEGINLDPIKDFEIVNISLTVQRFPIQIRNHTTTPPIDSNNLYVQTSEVINRLYNSTTPTFTPQKFVKTGHFLVFVPGSGEVELLSKMIKTGKNAVRDAMVLEAYSALGSDQINSILEPSTRRKIVITTNVMESAITLEGVEIVIDTMLERRPETSDSGGIRLVTDYESKASAMQRAGRTGRTCPGICYRMMTLKDYNNLRPIRLEEINRVPIYGEIISLLNSGLDPYKILPYISPEKINRSLNTLLNQNLITRHVSTGEVESDRTEPEYDVTDAGKAIIQFPLGVQTGKFLYDWLQDGNPYFPGIVIACLIDNYSQGYFYYPKQNSDETEIQYQIRLDSVRGKIDKFGDNDPLEVYLRMIIDALSSFQTLNPTRAEVVQWSLNNSVNAKRLKELISLINRTTAAVERIDRKKVQIGPFNTENALGKALPILMRVYDDSVMTYYRDSKYQNKNKVIYSVKPPDIWKRQDLPARILALTTIEIGKTGRNFRIISFYTGISNDIINPNQELFPSESELLSLIEGL